MYFRLTKNKVIGSIVIPVIMWIFAYIINESSTFMNDLPEFIMDFLNIHDFGTLFSMGNIIIFIIELVIVYVIWSLFQRRRVIIY